MLLQFSSKTQCTLLYSRRENVNSLFDGTHKKLPKYTLLPTFLLPRSRTHISDMNLMCASSTKELNVVNLFQNNFYFRFLQHHSFHSKPRTVEPESLGDINIKRLASNIKFLEITSKTRRKKLCLQTYFRNACVIKKYNWTLTFTYLGGIKIV